MQTPAQQQVPVSRIPETLMGDAASVETAAEELAGFGTNGTGGAPGDPIPEGFAPPLDYRNVRDLAEWASGMRDRQLRFDFRATPDGGRELVTVDLTHAGAPGSVVIPAFTTGKLSPVLYVKLTAEGAEGSVDAVARMADALFWSESAVEKFLVPYCASCAGSGAVAFLGKLLGAFNTPWQNAQVFALLHRSGRPTGEPLSLSTSVEVVFVDRSLEPNEVRVLGLDDFLGWAQPAAEDTPPPPPPPPVRYSVGRITAAEPRYPTYFQLREIAEWTASVRGTPLYFRHNVVTGVLGDPTSTLPPTLDNEVVIPACTGYVISGRRAPSAVWMQPDVIGGPLDLSPRGDALFLSTGAMEQFLFPYYASKEGVRALDELKELHDAWVLNQPAPEEVRLTSVSAVNTGESVVGVAADLPEEDEILLEEEVIVTGLVHLPKSDWVTVTGGTGFQALADVAVAHIDPAGTPRVLPFSEFQRRYRKRER